MKTTRFLLATLTLALVLGWPVPRALAITEREGFEVVDFPNSAAAVTPAFTYTPGSGSNLFSGQVAFGSGDADYFKIVVPPGLKVTSIQTTGSGFLLPTAPLYAGTYTCACDPGQILNTINWTITFTATAAADYEITTTGGQIILNDRSGFGDVLTLSEPFAGTIQFSAPGRSFSVDGGPFVTGNSGDFIPFGDISNLTTSVIVNAGAGNNTINVGDFPRTVSPHAFPSLTINGGTGNDTVNFTGHLTFVTNASLNVNLQDDATSPGVDAINVTGSAAQLIASGSGTIDLECSQSISITGGAAVQTADGSLTVAANQQTPATTGNFYGVNLDGAGTMLKVTGAGGLTVNGTGGNDSGGFQLGVNVSNGAQIIGGSGRSIVNVTGTGGASTNFVNRGVTVYGTGSAITKPSGYGSVTVTGTGGPNGSAYGIGVSVLFGGQISGTFASVSVNGTGRGAAGSSSNQGVEMGGNGSLITSLGYGVAVGGVAGPGASSGLFMDNSAAITTTVAQTGDDISISADSFSIDATASISTASFTAGASNNGVILRPYSSSTVVNVGGADAAGTLGLSEAKLDRVSTPFLRIESYNGDILLTAPITRPAATGVAFTSTTSKVRATGSGTDLSLAGGTATLSIPLSMPITGTTPDTGYPQLKVVGGVTLNNATLDLTGTTYAGTIGDVFTIIDNDGTDAITGTFNGLPEGASFAWPGTTPGLNARISYVGGDGNDVTLTLVSALTVTNTNASGPGSLPAAISFAASHAGADTITFDPSLSGQTIALSSTITISDSSPVTIDAGSLPGGVTIAGGGASFYFFVSNGKNATFRNVTFTGATASAFVNAGTLALTQCTFVGNAGLRGGAIDNGGGALTLNQCTLSSNSATSAGGAINNVNSATATLTQCTLSGNTCTGPIGGGAIYNDNSTLTLTHCTLTTNTAQNSSPPSGAILTTGTLTVTNSIVGGDPLLIGNQIVQTAGTATFKGKDAVQRFNLVIGDYSQDLGFITADPLLAPLDNYGGPTKTMALLPGSPARNAATVLATPLTADQRGFPIVGAPDIGAYEAGTLSTNYNAYIWESLPAPATAAQHAAGVDFDGDGVSNYNEWLALTNPADITSYFHITNSSLSNGYLSIFFPTGTGRNYILEFTAALSANSVWNPLQTIPGNGSIQGFLYGPLPPGITQLFFRIRTGP